MINVRSQINKVSSGVSSSEKNKKLEIQVLRTHVYSRLRMLKLADDPDFIRNEISERNRRGLIADKLAADEQVLCKIE